MSLRASPSGCECPKDFYKTIKASDGTSSSTRPKLLQQVEEMVELRTKGIRVYHQLGKVPSQTYSYPRVAIPGVSGEFPENEIVPTPGKSKSHCTSVLGVIH